MRAVEAKEIAMSKYNLYDSIQKSISYAASEGRLYCWYCIEENKFHWKSLKKDMIKLIDDGFKINFGKFYGYGSREDLLNLYDYNGDFDEGKMYLCIRWEDC